MKLTIICLTVCLVSFVDAETTETTTPKLFPPSWPPFFTKDSLDVERVINGQYSEPEKFPYVVLIEVYGDYQQYRTCAGTIIGDRWILTAAQCFINDFRATFVNIFIGASDLYNSMQLRDVHISNVIFHENFRQIIHEGYFYSDNDIALINVPQTIEFNEHVWPARLPYNNIDTPNTYAFAVGWGSFGENNSQRFLQYIEVFVGVKNECDGHSWPYPSNPLSILCTNAPPPTEVCYDDIGGPLILNDGWDDTIIGIASVIPTCGGRSTNYYTRLLFYMEWIEETIAQYERL